MNKFVAIIQGGGANFASITAALTRLGYESVITDDAKIINKANWVILPGVGAAQFAMQAIIAKNLSEVIKNLQQPVLGICLGQQLLCAYSEEGNGQIVPCLNIINAPVKQITNARIIPQMGWNNLSNITTNNPFLQGITSEDDFYFVHSYAVEIMPEYTQATCHYGIDFAAIIQYKNFFATQFHPEKSGKAGEKILQNFLNKSEDICK